MRSLLQVLNDSHVITRRLPNGGHHRETCQVNNVEDLKLLLKDVFKIDPLPVGPRCIDRSVDSAACHNGMKLSLPTSLNALGICTH